MEVAIACSVPTPLQHGMNAKSAGELADPFDGLFAALAHNVGRAKVPGERNSVGMSAHDDDLLGAESFGSNDTAQANRAVADHGHAVTAGHPCSDGRMMAGAHHVGECKERRH
jgi:hypothetical protein